LTNDAGNIAGASAKAGAWMGGDGDKV